MPRPLPQPIRGPVRCSRAARLRCPRMSSRAARAARGMSALALGLLQLIRGPVRCSRAARPALLRCPRTPSAGMSALALGLLLVLAAAVRAEERSVALAVAEHGFTPPEIEAAAGERLRPAGTDQTAGASAVERFRPNPPRAGAPGGGGAVFVS